MKTKQEITDFPTKGDDKKVSLRNSNYDLFPVDYAYKIKLEYPSIWREGGNIEGNAQFRRLKPIAENYGVPKSTTQIQAIRKREAWAARHIRDFRLAGTVAQMKWLVVGEKGLSHMKKLIQDEIDKMEKQKMIRKNLFCHRVKADQEKSFTFVASSENVDRMSDIINQSGWSLDAYRRNPVVLFNHDSRSLPVGRGSVEVVDGQLMIDIEFDEKDEMAQKIKSKVDGGFLNAVSVGFNAIKAYDRNSLPKESKYYGTEGRYFESAELLEVSIVTIPANSMATAAKGYTDENFELFLGLIAKHILDVIHEDGKYHVTYASGEHEEQHEEPMEQPEEPVEQDEEQALTDAIESVYGYEDDDDKDKNKDFETELYRALLA